MQRIVLITALLTHITSLNTVTGSTSPVPKTVALPTRTMPPEVFTNLQRLATPKPRRFDPPKGKSDSPMLNYIFDSYATSNKHIHDKFEAPSFEGRMSEVTTMEADTGATVNFDCRVSSLRDKMSYTKKGGCQVCALLQVSWLRVLGEDNLELLTLDLITHTTDSRYRVDVGGDTWRLVLSSAKVSDSGIYCCQVSTHPPMIKRFRLIVHNPEIFLTKEAFLETSETLSLKCRILHLHPGEHPSLRWYRGNSSISIDEKRGGVLIDTDKLTLTSQLQVAQLKMEDAGNYTCALNFPMKLKAIARVHVLQGSNLAELQSGVKITASYLYLLLAAILVLLGTFNDLR